MSPPSDPPPSSLELTVTTSIPASPAARLYIRTVTVAGVAVFLALGLFTRMSPRPTLSLAYWLFALLVLVGELVPITVPRQDDVEEITTSTTFSFALTMAWHVVPAMLATVLASAVSDLVRRKAPWKVLFNIAQYTLTTAGAGAVYFWTGGTTVLSARDLFPFVLAASARFALNNLITGVGIGLAQRVPVREYLLRDLRFQASTAAMLLSMSPLVVIVAGHSLLFVPLMLLPMAAVYLATKVSIDNARLVGELEQNVAGLTELNRLKDEFIAVISHELRTPLTSVQGYIKTLLTVGSDWGAEQRRSFLQFADAQSDRLAKLIEGLLSVSQLEAGRDGVRLGPVAIQPLLQAVVEELRPHWGSRPIDVRCECDPPCVLTDDMKVHRIVSNLLENALKYSPREAPVTVRVRSSDEGVVISVEDLGPGIPPSAQGRIFERFFQVDQSSTREVGGLGLGLYISRSLANLIGARLWLDRSGDDGSAFCLFLPQSLVPSAS